MIQGEPLEETPKNDAEGVESAALGLVMHAPDANRSPRPENASDYLSRTIESVVSSGKDDTKSVADSLEADVNDLVNALAEAEAERDDKWIETEQDDEPVAASDEPTLADVLADEEDIKSESQDMRLDSIDDDYDISDLEPLDALIGPDDDDEDKPVIVGSPVVKTDAPATTPKAEANDPSDSAPAAPPASTEPESVAQDGVVVEDAMAVATEPTPAPKQGDPAAGLLGLQAINVLNEKITASEDRNGDAMNKIGHALGVIAQRIDGLESRLTNQTIAKVAVAVAPPSMDDTPIDHSVAPYIARAERELKARKESGSMDIFDRIAKAAESEFDGQVSGTETRVIENPGDGRRVGTKKWKPSKTVKRRMERLEQAREVPADEDIVAVAEMDQPTAHNLRSDIDDIAAEEAIKSRAKAEVAPEPTLDLVDEEEDESGLSVVPGVRGRRRNRARKSRLDEDFENVFDEDEGKPSIQSVRRKMRDRPVEEPVEAETRKGGMLGNILGRKSAKNVAPVEPVELDEFEEEEDDLMAAFDAPEERAEKAPSKRKMAKAALLEDDDDDFDEDFDDVSSSRKKRSSGPLLYVVLAAAAAAGFFVWKTFIA